MHYAAKRHRLTGAIKRLREPAEHSQVSVKLDAQKAANTKRNEAILVFERCERALNGRAPSVQPKTNAVTGDRGVAPLDARKRATSSRALATLAP